MRVWAGLVDGVYQAVALEELEEGILQGHSAVLNLDLRWEHGALKWHDPETGRHIATYDDQVARAERAEAQVSQEREARAILEAQLRELKAQLQRPNS